MKLNNTLGLAIMALVKAYIVRPVVELDVGSIVVGGYFVKGFDVREDSKYPEYITNDWALDCSKYYYLPVIHAPTRLDKSNKRAFRSILDKVEDSIYLSKIQNLDQWLPPAPWFTMVLKQAWDNRNNGYVINDHGVMCKIFPKPEFIKGWI